MNESDEDSLICEILEADESDNEKVELLEKI